MIQSTDTTTRKLSEIKCIFFSEFHAEYGPRIVCQVPDNFVSKEVFDAVSVYIIPKPEIQHRTVTNKIVLNTAAMTTGSATANTPPTTTHPHSPDVSPPPPPLPPPTLKFIGYPNSIVDACYARNAFIFNVCLVCDGAHRTLPYEPVVRKLSNWLVLMETSGGGGAGGGRLLSSEAGRQRLPHLLHQTMTELNNGGVTVLSLDNNVSVYLRVMPWRPAPGPVEDHDVPVWLGARPRHLAKWDMTSQRVIPHIDGVAHVAKLAHRANVHVQLVKACVTNLLYVGRVRLVSVFQYSNTYSVTDKISQLYTDQQLQQQCTASVSRQGGAAVSIGDVFKMYCALSNGRTVRELCCEINMVSAGVDERKLILFGLLNGIIRRIHKYPVYIGESETTSLSPKANGGRGIVKSGRGLGFGGCGVNASGRCYAIDDEFLSQLDGTVCVDALCVRTGLSSRHLIDQLERNPRTMLLWK